MKRVLSIDGGGIKGVFPASFLTTLEESLGANPAEFFDLIVGTSTGGIIALGLGLGLSARDILTFYEQHGPVIFAGNRFVRFLRHIGLSKYSSAPLRTALESVFGDRTLGESSKRLVIPSANLDTGEVHIWKTAHHIRFERDYRARVVDVALATSAAPTYFPTHRCAAGSPLIDGGVWANNPIGVAAVEARGVLGWPADCVRILSLGCTETPIDVRWGQWYPLGWAYWGTKMADVFMRAQSSGSLGTAQHLVADRNNVVRINPVVSGRFGLDTLREIDSLRGLGASEARNALPSLRQLFFDAPAEAFVPFHSPL
jgi:patatin-like phospholipase/acyl hydrolase